MVICGMEDGWSPPERHERMAGLILGATLRLIDRSGHMAMMEEPEAVLRALREWLDMKSN
jgi:pimeloyl-ACP methyl ester carboxylesterase